MSDWVMALDNLAASGVIDYDAPAFILGQQPRYIGHPDLASLSVQNPAYLQGTKIKSLQADSFQNNNNLVQNPKWKKILFAGVAVGGTLLIAASLISLKRKIKLPKFLKFKSPQINTPKFTAIKNFGQKILSFVKKPINWVKTKLG